jgi:hypothetical protein
MLVFKQIFSFRPFGKYFGRVHDLSSKICGPKKDKVREKFRILNNEELRD